MIHVFNMDFTTTSSNLVCRYAEQGMITRRYVDFLCYSKASAFGYAVIGTCNRKQYLSIIEYMCYIVIYTARHEMFMCVVYTDRRQNMLRYISELYGQLQEK